MVLVAYDIPDDKRRTKVMKALERLGRRVQYSVFLSRRSPPETIAATLEPLIDPAEDNVRIHVLCAACTGKALLLGRARTGNEEHGYRVV